MSTALSQGANAPLTAVRVRIEVTARQRLDVSGLLITKAGKVRSDADLVFYNAPRGPGVTHNPTSGSLPDAITVDTWAVPSDVATVVITASLDGQGATFAGIDPTATVLDADTGRVLATFTPPRLGRETALVLVEVYRRGAEWKIRAVGQGYANGLAGIAADFGVSISDAAPVTPPCLPSPTTPRRSPPPPTSPRCPPTRPRPARHPGQGPGQPGQGRLRLPGQGRPPAAEFGPDGARLAARPARPQHRPGRLLHRLRRPARAPGYRLVHEAQRLQRRDPAHRRQPHRRRHRRRRGHRRPPRRPAPEVCGLVFVVNSFSGQRFTDVRDAYCRLLDATTREELVRFDLTNAEPHTGVIMCKLVRQLSGEWVMTALGEYVDAKTARGMVKPSAALL